MEQTFTPAQVVRIVNISRRGLDLKIEKGTISTTLVNGKKRISISELMRVFPETTPEMIENGCSVSTKKAAEIGISETENLVGELTSKISKLEGEKKLLEVTSQFQKEKIEMLEERVRKLEEEKLLAASERSKTLDMISLLISQNGQKRLEAGTVQRDAKGRFVKKEEPKKEQPKETFQATLFDTPPQRTDLSKNEDPKPSAPATDIDEQQKEIF